MKSWQTYAILTLSVAVVWLLFFRTPPAVTRLDEQVKAFEREIQAKEDEARELRHQAATLYQRWYLDSLEKKDAETRFNREILTVRKELAGVRKVAEPIVQRNDTVRILVEAYDSLVALQERRIDDLLQRDRISAMIARDLLSVQKAEITICSEIVAANESIIAAQRKQIRKLRTGRAVRNVAIGAAAVGGFLLGLEVVD